MKLTKLKLLVTGPFIAWKLVKAEDCAAKGNYEKADSLYSDIWEYFTSDPEYYLNRAYVSHKLDKADCCMVFLDNFYRITEKHKRYSQEEKNYLYCYADRVLEKIKRVSENMNIPYRGKFDELEPEKVRKSLQLSFPVHVNQNFEEWLEANR